MIPPIIAQAGLNPSDYLQWGSLGVGFFNIFLSWRLINSLNKQAKITTPQVILVCIFVASAIAFLIGGAFLHRWEQNPEVTISFDLSPRWSDTETHDYGSISLRGGGQGSIVNVKDDYIPLKVAKGTVIQLDIKNIWKKLQEFDSQLKAFAKEKVTKDKTAGGPDNP